MRTVQHIIAANATVTTSASGAQLTNPRSQLGEPNGGITAAVIVTVGTVTGTTPSLVYNVEVSNDGTNWFVAGSTTAITATGGKQRVVVQNILENYIRVSPVVTGTTPSFASTNVTLILG